MRLERIEKRYHRGSEVVHALRGVDLEVDAGEWVALVGPSGCGKSTLLNVVTGVDTPDAGRALVCGIDVARAEEEDLLRLRRHHVGIVFQGFHLMPRLSALENVALPLAVAGRPDAARAGKLLERVGLAERLDHLPSELSGGEQQRTAIARALAHSPEVLVADEPTGNLDSETGARILDLLDELRREHGTALLFATHDERLAARADRVVALADGRVLAGGAP